jgi:hypothetical protein
VTIDPRSARERVLLLMYCVHMYIELTQTNITIMLMLLFASRTVKLFAARQGIFNNRHFHFDDSHRTPKWKNGQTDDGNSECQYSSWMDITDVDSEESPRVQDMTPKPQTHVSQALYPQVQLSSGGTSAL